jgi:hypothetical protein
MYVSHRSLRREASLWRICTVGGLCVYCLDIHSCWHESYEISLLTWMSNMGAWRMAGHCSSRCLHRTSLFEELWLWCNDWTLQYFDMKECGSAKHHQCRTSWRIHIQSHIIHKAKSLLFWVVCWDFCPCTRDEWITWKIGCIIASCGELHVCRRWGGCRLSEGWLSLLFHWELMKSVGCHGSSSLLFVMKVMVWHSVSGFQKVRTVQIVPHYLQIVVLEILPQFHK